MKTKHNRLSKLTPFLVLEIMTFLLSSFLIIKDSNGWGGLFGTAGLVITGVLFVVDLILRKQLKNNYRKIFIVEVSIIILLSIWFSITSY